MNDFTPWTLFVDLGVISLLLLAAFGIASIKLSVVVEYIVPLSILLLTGLIFTLLYVIFAARRLMRECWFEKALFTWGWFTGTMAIGIALLRVVDTGMRSLRQLCTGLPFHSAGGNIADNVRPCRFLCRIRADVLFCLPGGRRLGIPDCPAQRIVH